MILYIIMILCALFFSLKIKGVNKKYKLIVLFVLLWAICSFRGIAIGNDTKTYYALFNNAGDPSFITNYSGRYEIGFLFLNKIIHLFTSNFTIFLCIVNAFIYYSYYRFVKNNSINPSFSVFLFITLGFFGQTMNVIRLQIALVICLFTKNDNNKLKSLAIIVIASLFQRIAIIYILSLFIPKKMEIRYLVGFGAFGTLIFVFFNDILKITTKLIPYYSTYLNSTRYVVGEVKTATVITIIIQLSVFIFCIIFLKNKNMSQYFNRNIEFNSLMVNTVYYVFISLILSIISIRFNLLDRCANLFWTSVIITLPNIISIMKYNKLMAKSIIIISCIFLFFVVNIVKKEWNSIYPYEISTGIFTDNSRFSNVGQARETYG